MARLERPAKLGWYKIQPQLLLMLACLAGGLFGFYRYYSPPMGHGPAGPTVPAGPFAHVWRDDEVLLLGMGDRVVTRLDATADFGSSDAKPVNPWKPACWHALRNLVVGSFAKGASISSLAQIGN